MFSGRLFKSIICLVLKTFLHFQCDNVKYYSYDNCFYKPILLLSVYSPYLYAVLNQNNLAIPNLANNIISNVSLQSKIVEGVRACRKSQLLNEWKIVFVTHSAVINLDS